MNNKVYLFATSGGHYGELRQWASDIQFETIIYVDGPSTHKLGNDIIHIKKINGIYDALVAAYSIILGKGIQSPKAFISAGAQNALTAYLLSIFYRVPYLYVESFQRTEGLSRSGVFSVLVAKKVFLFHDIDLSYLPRWIRLIINFRKNIILNDRVLEK